MREFEKKYLITQYDIKKSAPKIERKIIITNTKKQAKNHLQEYSLERDN